jgi:stage II sporulation protein P
MALAVKLTAQLEKMYPGITRPISFRSQRFNQDLSSGALLVEVGAAGNTRQEALQAAQALAEGILALAGGAN